MSKTLYIGFKGQNNSSAAMVNSLSGQHVLLTNSFAGLKRDIDRLPAEYDRICLFGADKSLTDSFRIEQCAEKEGVRLVTELNTAEVSKRLAEAGIRSEISNTPTQYLCNEAYWWLLEKYRGRALLIHIPTMRNFNEIFEKKPTGGFLIGENDFE